MSKIDTRPTWDQYFLNIAKEIARRSRDPNTHVGAVIVDLRNRIVSTGYNSFPQGVDDNFWPLSREKVECTGDLGTFRVDKYQIITHAEANAIASSRESLVDCSLYCTLFPCNECAKLIITAGIKKVCYNEIREDDSHKISYQLMKQAGIELVQVNSSFLEVDDNDDDEPHIQATKALGRRHRRNRRISINSSLSHTTPDLDVVCQRKEKYTAKEIMQMIEDSDLYIGDLYDKSLEEFEELMRDRNPLISSAKKDAT